MERLQQLGELGHLRSRTESPPGEFYRDERTLSSLPATEPVGSRIPSLVPSESKSSAGGARPRVHLDEDSSRN